LPGEAGGLPVEDAEAAQETAMAARCKRGLDDDDASVV
jgi:hypothetical protein